VPSSEEIRRSRQPKIVDPAHPLIERVRGLCVDLPDVVEVSAWGWPTFRVAKRIFCVAGSARERPLAVSFKPDPDERLAYSQDARFFVPPYWGTVGWLAIDLDSPTRDWTEISELIETSYREIAPARLVRMLDASLT
jgi:predicted DNA-binding protein (MmcQ/YjbR family)